IENEMLVSLNNKFINLTNRKSYFLTLSNGSNKLEIVLKSKDNFFQKYQVNIIRQNSPDSILNTLIELSVSDGNLFPEFSPGVNLYELEVPISINSISLMANSHPNSTLSINGIQISDSSGSFLTPLHPGINEIEISVAGENSINIYTIKVNRKIPNSNNLLDSISLSTGNLYPSFSSTTNHYELLLPKNTNTLDIGAFSQNPDSEIRINGIEINSSNTSITLNPIVGLNSAEIWVTAPNGASNIYLVKILKPSNLNKRIFITNNAYTGNLGGKSGADEKCNSDPNHPGDGSLFKAMLASNPISNSEDRKACSSPNCTNSAQNLDWVFQFNTAYNKLQSNEYVFLTNAAGIIENYNFYSSVDLSQNHIWTGLDSDWTNAGDNCNDWTDSSSSFNGTTGNSITGSGSFHSNEISSCNIPKAILCVEQ
ncbi:MAG: DUF1554 domain-containing protein, partial [Leptospiraceae bacterium]|nr:DUF1554 domain-containing protein [Leptospiraceae bacterium]